MWEVWVWFQGWHSRVRGLAGGGGRLDGVGEWEGPGYGWVYEERWAVAAVGW